MSGQVRFHQGWHTLGSMSAHAEYTASRQARMRRDHRGHRAGGLAGDNDVRGARKSGVESGSGERAADGGAGSGGIDSRLGDRQQIELQRREQSRQWAL
jgi:hypothetical protein